MRSAGSICGGAGFLFLLINFVFLVGGPSTVVSPFVVVKAVDDSSGSADRFRDGEAGASRPGLVATSAISKCQREGSRFKIPLVNTRIYNL